MEVAFFIIGLGIKILADFLDRMRFEDFSSPDLDDAFSFKDISASTSCIGIKPIFCCVDF